jgi:hypothetical protein
LSTPRRRKSEQSASLEVFDLEAVVAGRALAIVESASGALHVGKLETDVMLVPSGPRLPVPANAKANAKRITRHLTRVLVVGALTALGDSEPTIIQRLRQQGLVDWAEVDDLDQQRMIRRWRREYRAYGIPDHIVERTPGGQIEGPP